MRRLLVATIIGGAGAMAWLVALIMGVQRIRLMTVGRRGLGTVVDEAVSGASAALPGARKSGPAVSPVIEVMDATTGRPIRVQSSFGSSETAVTIGEQVPVRYLPGQPDQAEIDALLPMWGLPVMAALVGTVLLAAWWFLPHGPS